MLPGDVAFVSRPQLDLDRPERVEDTMRRALGREAPDVVVSAAAWTDVDGAERNPDAARRRNALAPEAIARTTRRAGVPLVHLSTDFVFAGLDSEPKREEDVPAPVNAYGRTKLEGEGRVRAADPDAIVVRTAWVHSPWGANFVRSVLRWAEERDTVEAAADQHGSPTSALHLAAALVALAERLPDPSLVGSYHLAGEGRTSRFDVARAVLRESERLGGPRAAVRPVSADRFPLPAPRPGDTALDTSRARLRLGLVLPPWEEGVRDTVRRVLGSPPA